MIDELNPTPAKPKEPHKIGDNPKNKVRILRPFLIDDTRVDKGDVAFVTDAHLKSHGHIFEKLALIAFLLSALCFSSQAQSYSANQDLASGPFWSAITNAVALGTGAQPATGNIAGGVMNTNSVKAGQNVTALTTPVGLTRYDECAIMVTGNLITNAGGSLASQGARTLAVYPSEDGVNVDTNNPIASLIVTPTLVGGGFTNFMVCTNLPRTIIGAHGFISFGWNNASTNTDTNDLIQVFVKPQHSG